MSTSPLLAVSRRLRSTPFTSRVLAQGAKAFTVYNHMLLPTEFESVEADYWHLCSHVQVWDVGAERQVSIQGLDAQRLVQWMTPRDISTCKVGQCVYLPLADEDGRLINDPVGLKLAENHWWLSLADSDVLLWAKGLSRGANLDVMVSEPAIWPLAVQGPQAETLMERIFGADVKNIRFFRFEHLAYKGHTFLVARSGWSKQGGFEIYIDDIQAGQQLYDDLFEVGADLQVNPGSPNLIERMESTLLSYGNDMDSRHSPIEAGLADFMHLDKELDSLSHNALRAEVKAGPTKRLCGLLLKSDVPTPIAEYPIQNDPLSFVGSQVWSPRYDHQIATIMLDAKIESPSEMEIKLADGSNAIALICNLPFDFTQVNAS